MLISHDPNETRVAIVEDGALVEFYVERSKRSVVGNVYLGKVKDVLPGMEAAFVDIGLEKNAFLYVDEVIAPEGLSGVPRRDIAELLRPGQEIVVQVLRDPMGTKGARITTDIALPGRFIVLMPYSEFVGVSRKLPSAERDRLHETVQSIAPEGMGMIVRTAAAGVGPQEIQSDLDFLLRLWKRVSHQAHEGLAPEVVYTEMDLALRMVRDVFGEDFRALIVDDKQTYEKVTSFLKKTSPGLLRRVSLHKDKVALFDYFSLQEQLEAGMRRRVWLPSGGYIAIDATEALTAVDVNTARFVGKRSLEETILRTNLEAASEVVRQLRLRDIGGIIVVDFIDMERAENRERVMRSLRESLEKDRAKTRLTEMSQLGLVEMTRKNVSDGPFRVLTQACPACQGEGRVLSDTSRRIMIERRIREILRAGRSEAYLFGLSAESLALVNRPGANLPAVLKAETGRHVAFVEEADCGPAEVRVLMEGRASALKDRPR
jgi:ribonuclease G